MKVIGMQRDFGIQTKRDFGIQIKRLMTKVLRMVKLILHNLLSNI
jgi:hypothetical protein